MHYGAIRRVKKVKLGGFASGLPFRSRSNLYLPAIGSHFLSFADSLTMSASPTQFNSDEIDHAYPPGIERHYWTQARCRIIESYLRILPQAGGRVFEVGCGRGIVVGALRRSGVDCLGVEPSPAPVPDELRPFVITNVTAQNVSAELRLSVRTLMLLDVIEHVPEPVAFLKEILEAFPKAEFLLISVPARAELWSNFDDFFRHFRRYDRAMLRDTFSQIGGEALRLNYAFHLLYPVMWLLLRLGSRSTRVTAPTGLAALLHALMGWVLYFDSWLIPSAVWGTSLIGLARLRRTP